MAKIVFIETLVQSLSRFPLCLSPTWNTNVLATKTTSKSTILAATLPFKHQPALLFARYLLLRLAVFEKPLALGAENMVGKKAYIPTC